jgi:hypothetical protein
VAAGLRRAELDYEDDYKRFIYPVKTWKRLKRSAEALRKFRSGVSVLSVIILMRSRPFLSVHRTDLERTSNG